MYQLKLKSWLIAAFFVSLIFYLSSIPGLQVLPLLRQLSSLLGRFDLSLTRFSIWLGDLIPLNFNELRPFKILSEDFLVYAGDNPAIIEFLLRKIAHVVMFFFITTALFLLASQYTKKPRTAIILAFLGGISLAFLDEYRQSFVPTRVASSMDVLINSIGVCLAIFIIHFSLFITKSARLQEYYHNKLINKSKGNKNEDNDVESSVSSVSDISSEAEKTESPNVGEDSSIEEGERSKAVEASVAPGEDSEKVLQSSQRFVDQETKIFDREALKDVSEK